MAALKFMEWIGINVDFVHIPYERNFQVQAEKHVNIKHLESLLNNYSFNDPSLLVEALTHGSYMLPQIPRCYQVQSLIMLIRIMLFISSILECTLAISLYLGQ